MARVAHNAQLIVNENGLKRAEISMIIGIVRRPVLRRNFVLSFALYAAVNIRDELRFIFWPHANLPISLMPIFC